MLLLLLSLHAGRDASTDASPFGLAALMDNKSFQRRQVSSTLAKIEKTKLDRVLPPAARSDNCLFIVEETVDTRDEHAAHIGESQSAACFHASS